jgi:hypothetical protein
MSVTCESLDNGYIFAYRLTDPLTVDELTPRLLETKAIRDSADHKIHTLVNLKQICKVPSGIIRMRISPDLTHRTSGYMVIVGANPLVESFVMTIAALARFKKISFFGNEADGSAYLRNKINEDLLNNSV